MKKQGFTIVELTAAIAVLAVCAVLFTQLVILTSSLRRDERTRQTAIDQMHNIMERFAAKDFGTYDFDKTAAESLIERSLPNGKIVFDTKRLESNNVVFIVTVSWSNGEKRPRSEVAMFRLLTP